MQSTMKNLTFVACYVRCTITKKVIVVQSSLRHFTLQPQSIVWHLQYALDNASREGKIQWQETCRMATNTINVLDEGGMQGCNCKCKGTKSIQNLCPFLPLLWLNTFSLAIKSTMASPSWFAPTMCGLSHTGSNLRQRYSQVGTINNEWSTPWKLPKIYTCATIKGGAKDISMDAASKVRSAHEPTKCCLCCGVAHEAFHNGSGTCHATLIAS